LKYSDIEEIVLVDLDQRIVDLAKENPHLLELNQASSNNHKVQLIQGDAVS
jgi:spermidine synthase